MARIPTYQKDIHISDLDRIIGTGADIILGVATGGTPVNITQGDRDVVISLTYRILDF